MRSRRKLDREPRKQHPRFTPEPGFRSRWLPRIIIGTGLAIVAAVMVVAAGLGNPGDGQALDQSLDGILPLQGALEPRQTPISIDLAEGWVLEQLVIEGVPINTEFIDAGGAPLGIYSFQPGPGKPFESFEVGQVRILAIVQNLLNDRDQRTITWSFTAS